MSSNAAAAAASAPSSAADPNALSVEESEAVVALRERIRGSKKRGPGVEAMYTELELAKFIVVAKCDVEKAYKRFKNYHALRVKHKFCLLYTSPSPRDRG